MRNAKDALELNHLNTIIICPISFLDRDRVSCKLDRLKSFVNVRVRNAKDALENVVRHGIYKWARGL